MTEPTHCTVCNKALSPRHQDGVITLTATTLAGTRLVIFCSHKCFHDAHDRLTTKPWRTTP
jgi:hypothetical protein